MRDYIQCIFLSVFDNRRIYDNSNSNSKTTIHIFYFNQMNVIIIVDMENSLFSADQIFHELFLKNIPTTTKKIRTFFFLKPYVQAVNTKIICNLIYNIIYYIFVFIGIYYNELKNTSEF